MTKENKKKLLGQYFSGRRIANALYDLLDKPKGKSVIDPMCGQADLLLPFMLYNQVHGVEIDEAAFRKASLHLGSEKNLVHANAFAADTLGALNKKGYDIVITNPPYVRATTYRKAEQEIESYLPMNAIFSNLKSFIFEADTLTEEEKRCFSSTLENLSGFCDIATIAWLLCMTLTKPNGYLAIVVPSTWLGREYSSPIVSVLKRYFNINYIVNDTNSVWFSEEAQVKTALVVAKRVRNSSPKNPIQLVEILKGAVTEESITSFLEQGQSFKAFLESGTKTIPGKLESTIIPQASFAKEGTTLDATSKLSTLCNTPISFANFDSLGISLGQGFRSGANACFVFHKEGNTLISKIGSLPFAEARIFFEPIIQNQKSLGHSYSVCPKIPSFWVLYIKQGYAREKDILQLPIELQVRLKAVPALIEAYLDKAENYEVKGTRVPNLTAIKSNSSSKNGQIRFWYNLPPFTQRHRAKVFVPRVNGSQVLTRINLSGTVVDANFVTFWAKAESSFDDYGILALLNSKWCRILYEEMGIVMGGGALKLDAAQIKKIPIPQLDASDANVLNELGKKLSTYECTTKTADEVINQIDKLILKKVCYKFTDSECLSFLEKQYINKRTK